MRPADLATAGLRHHRRSHVAVALGVAAATAVLTGALLVGDSVRGSLRGLTLKRLASVDQALVTQQRFRADLATELQNTAGFTDHFASAHAAILTTGSLSSRGEGGRAFAAGVQVTGIVGGAESPVFGAPAPLPGPIRKGGQVNDGLHLTPALAEELSVGVGDEVVLRLPAFSTQPADSTLGDKTGDILTARLPVRLITPRAGFQLAPSQRPPRCVGLDLALLQRLLDEPGAANAILLAGKHPDRPAPREAEAWLNRSVAPTLDDLGLRVEAIDSAGVVQIESSQLVLPDRLVEAIETAFPSRRQPVVTYLANTIRLVSAKEGPGTSVPYSTVAGIDSRQEGPLLDEDGEPILLANNEVVLNRWAAERLGAEPGDTITLTYYEPESTHGKLVEAPPVSLTLKAVVPITGAAGDPRLTPELEGVTDADSINDWDLPFDLTEPIARADEDYWDEHSTTPKAFVSLALAKRLWATRWGSISLIRVSGADADAVSQKLRDAINPAEMGFVFQPVKRLGLEASAGSTPFDGLFFGFSLFLIASAVLLIVLLFGLGVEQRSREVGLLAAVGWDQQRTRRVLMREGLIVAAAGVAIGVPCGILYAWLMILGLTTVWVAAIAVPFLSLHVTLKSLLIGAGLGLVFAWGAIRRALRGVVSRPTRSLLAGQAAGRQAANGKRGSLWRWLTPALLVGALGLGFAATGLRGESQAGAFFGSGALLLIGLLLAVRRRLARPGSARPAPRQFGGWSLAIRNTARAPGRSLLTVALVACASFLILAISAFRLDPTEEGTGGFVLVGQSDQPIHFDLNTPEGRSEFAFIDDDLDLLDKFRVHALRVHDGEDASCLNLYQTRQPRVLGARRGLLKRGGFAFADGDNRPLQSGVQDRASAVPTLLDFNTAMYSLKLYGGVGSRLAIRDGVDRPVDVEVAGLLKNSILQGDLLLGEADFLRLYPATGGYRFFLIEPATKDTSGGDAEKLAAMLEDRLSDYGFDTEETRARLAGFLAVQNTYLSTFQSLGALGLLLGAVGVAVVQLRNLAERRGEIALLRASGFDAGLLRSLVFRENLLLLAGGLVVGALAAAAALVPQAISQSTRLPWLDSGLLLAAIALVGLVVGSLATRRATRAPIVAALRGD